MSSTSGSILRFISSSNSSSGEDDVSLVNLLRKAIFHHFKQPRDPRQENLLCIQNKYFTANVALIETSVDLENFVEDGIVLVFMDDKLGFDEVVKYHEAKKDVYGDTLRLCVSVVNTDEVQRSKESEKDFENEYSRRVLWCLDNGYEYVEGCDLSEKGLITGHEVREKEGFPRVIEAIESTIWSSADMNAKPKASHSIPVQKAQHVSNDIAENRTSQNQICGEQKIDAMPKEYYSDVNPSLHEAAVNDLEKLMGEAKTIRDEARSGNVSDEIRRQRAEETAMKLMDLLEKFDFEDDEENEFSDNDE